MANYNIPYTSGNDPEPLTKGVGYDITTYAGKYNGKEGNQLIFIDSKGVVSKYSTDSVRSGQFRFTRGTRNANNNYYASAKGPGVHILKGRFLERAMEVTPSPNTRSKSKPRSKSKTRAKSNGAPVVRFNPLFRASRP